MKGVCTIKQQPILSISFFRYQCDFRQGYSTQKCLPATIEKWEKVVNNGGVFGALLADLPKAFD